MWWKNWWRIAVVLQAALAHAAPTICDEKDCRCDSFTKVICNCTNDNEITLRPDGAYSVPSSATGIMVDGCSRVYFLPETVRGLIQLRHVELRNVAYVVIKEHALAWSPFSSESDMNPGLKITIHNCTINEISSHAIQGRIDDIIITNSRVKDIKPFAFSSLTGVQNIELTANVFDNIEIQSFKKFSTWNFILRGGTVNTLPSRFLSDVEVTNLFKMDGVTVHYVYSLTFLINSPKRVLIENNVIETLEGDSFHAVTRGPITFRNNTIGNLNKGALLGFTVDRRVSSIMGAQELLLDNNTITNLNPQSLLYNRSTLSLRVDGLNMNVTCSCELVLEWAAIMKEQGGIITCWYPLEGHYISLPTYMDSRCGTFKNNFWIFVVVGLVLVLLIAAVVVFVIVRRENEKKKKLQIAMPDGKTYRETEFHIVVERAELLTTDL